LCSRIRLNIAPRFTGELHEKKLCFEGLIYCTFTAHTHKSLIINGAGEGNRTLVSMHLFLLVANQHVKFLKIAIS